MKDEQMLASMMGLPDPDLLTATKITDPIGAGSYYRADTVVRLLTLCGMRLVFQCLADDFEHAEKQAKSIYPDCIIISIDKGKQNGIHDSKS